MITLSWKQGMQFEARDELDNKIFVDTTKENGGTETGIAPLQLILVALAGCMAMDIVSILQKKKAKIDSFKMTIDGQRAEDHPRRYTKITCRIACVGQYKKEDLERSFELSRDKYCSALATVKNPPEIEFLFS